MTITTQPTPPHVSTKEALSKREFFYAHVLMGLAANPTRTHNSPEHLAKIALEITDEAMKQMDLKETEV